MCDICEFMLTAEHDPSVLERAREDPCVRCGIFAAGNCVDDDDTTTRMCYHCYINEDGPHEKCPLCEKPPQ